MILRRLRLRAGFYISGFLMLAGCTLGAHATQVAASDAVTRAEMYATIGAAGAVVIGALWVLLTTINGKTEKTLSDAVNRLEFAVEKLVDGLTLHNVDPLAHTAASEHNHNPMNEKLDKLDQRQQDIYRVVVGLKAEHDLIRSEEDELCSILRARRAAEAKKRTADPADFDGRPLRENK